jgi:hypothetical protein
MTRARNYADPSFDNGLKVTAGVASSTPTTLTDAATIAWDASVHQITSVTLADDRAFGAPTDQEDGAVYILTINQDATGTRVPSWNAVFKFVGASAPTLSTAANAKDTLVFISDGTNMNEIGRALNIG